MSDKILETAKRYAGFTSEGKYMTHHLTPTLFWSKPTIIYPPPPAVKVVEGWVGFYKDCNGYVCPYSAPLFETEAKANRSADQDPSIPRAVFVRHEYTVKEDK